MPHRRKIRDVILDVASAYLPLILTAILALGSWHMARQAPSVEKPAQVLADDVPDFRMDDFAVSRFNAKGDLIAHIQGTHAQHFLADDALHMEHMESYWRSTQNTTTTARADYSISYRNAEMVDLKGKTKIIIHPAAKDNQKTANSPIFIQSETMRLWPEEQKLHTPSHTTIARADGYFQSTGMDYDNRSGILNLKSKVQGILWPQKP